LTGLPSSRVNSFTAPVLTISDVNEWAILIGQD
jgi:hypothetical protein